MGRKITNLGKELRKIRLANDEILNDMAVKLNITPAYLSSIENGKREMTDDLLNKIKKIYKIKNADANLLKAYSDELKTKLKIDISSMNNNDKELILSFARCFDGLTFDEKEKIRNLINISEKNIKRPCG